MRWGGMDTKANRYILYRIELKKREENQSLENNELGFNNLLSLEHIMPKKWENTWSLPLLADGNPSWLMILCMIARREFLTRTYFIMNTARITQNGKPTR